MKPIQKEYIIDEQVLSLEPAYNIDYQTIVTTTTGKVYVNQTPLEIIKGSCLRDFTSYESRRYAVMNETGFKNKVPIPVNITHGIYALPTSSPSNSDCVWIFFKHIERVEELNSSATSNKAFRSKVRFLNGDKLLLAVSQKSVQNQIYKAAICKNIIESKQQIKNAD